MKQSLKTFLRPNSIIKKIYRSVEKSYIGIENHGRQHNGICHSNIRAPLLVLPTRSFYAWLNNIFNKVDPERIKEVGPDRACAEWLLRCGATVKWKEKEKELKDYNSLPVGNFKTLTVESVDATDSAIMEAGFGHFRELQHFRKLILKNCRYITDESIPRLVFITKDQLEWLEVSDNGNVTDASIVHLGKLSKLKYLKLEDLPGVTSPKDVFEKLKISLPNCEILFDNFSSSDEE